MGSSKSQDEKRRVYEAMRLEGSQYDKFPEQETIVKQRRCSDNGSDGLTVP
jgi:hypothetical protein